MARYKHYDYAQSKLIPVQFDRQVLPGTFEYTLSYLIEHSYDICISAADNVSTSPGFEGLGMIVATRKKM